MPIPLLYVTLKTQTHTHTHAYKYTYADKRSIFLYIDSIRHYTYSHISIIIENNLITSDIIGTDPPNEPEITGYTNGQVIQTNHTLKLVCVARGGNPLAQVCN